MQDRKRYRSRYEPAPPRRTTSADIAGWIERRELTTPLPEDERLPAAYDDRDIAAIKACRYGTASPEQQQRAIEWIVWAAGTYHEPYRPDPLATARLTGRASIGREIVKLINSKTGRQADGEQG
jgi:hypothetical protein